MTDKGKEKLFIAVISIVLTAALSIPGTLIASKPSLTQNIIQLPDGQTVNADEIAALNSENAALQSENAALRENLTEQANAVLTIAAQPTEGSTTTEPSLASFFLDVASRTSSNNTDYVPFNMAGNMYTNGMVWGLSSVAAVSIHPLHGKYTRLEGTIGHVDETDLIDGTLFIYYDNVKKHEIPLKAEMYPEPFVLDDLQGIKQIKFEVHRNAFGFPKYGLGDITIK